MAFDEASGQMVLLDPAMSGTWTWDGVHDWQHAATAGPVSTAIKDSSEPFGMAYDSHSRSLIAEIGDYARSPGAAPPPPATWSWHDGRWTRLEGTRTPPVWGGAIAQFPPGHELVMFGGCCGSSAQHSTALRGTWVWDGATWNQLQPAHSPPARWGESMAYDASIQKLVMLGGMTAVPNGQWLDDMWAWDGTDWSELESPPVGPGQITSAPDGSILLFGSSAAWAWSGSAWSQVKAVTPDCFLCVAGFDPLRRVTVLVTNPEGSAASMDQVWTWNGAAWKQRS
jgi:hypothetical protein